MNSYEVWYADDLGNRLSYVSDIIELEYVKTLGDTGYLRLVVPSAGQIYDNEEIDRRIFVYRYPIDGTMYLDYSALIRKSKIQMDSLGRYQRVLYGVSLNELLRRRIVAYYAKSDQARMTNEADDMMKEIVRDNFIDNADYSGTPSPARDIDSYGFSVQSDKSQGPSITKSFSWRPVLNVLQSLQLASKMQGTEVFFEIQQVTETTMEFRTWTTARDRTTTTGSNPVVFSPEWGNLTEPSLVCDRENEYNYIYAGGQGMEEFRLIKTSSDTARMKASRLNRRERFAFSQGHLDNAVQEEARSVLERGRPTVKFFGELIDTPLTPYGGLNGWGLGDKVTMSFADRQLDVLIRAVHVRSTKTAETIKAKAETL